MLVDSGSVIMTIDGESLLLEVRACSISFGFAGIDLAGILSLSKKGELSGNIHKRFAICDFSHKTTWVSNAGPDSRAQIKNQQSKINNIAMSFAIIEDAVA